MMSEQQIATSHNVDGEEHKYHMINTDDKDHTNFDAVKSDYKID